MTDIWIVKTGCTFPQTASELGDFDHWTREGLALEDQRVRVLDVHDLERLPEPAECRGVVITGSHDMVTDRLAWSVRLEHWIAGLVEVGVPLLGICYGHQLLAQAMQGKVDYHPAGREVGTVQVELLDSCGDDPLFRDLPRFMSAHVVHAQTVTQLPTGAVRLAGNNFEPNHAFRIGNTAWGVQFHPEYDRRVMRSYIEQMRDVMSAAGYDVARLLSAVHDTPVARQILSRFGRLVTS